MGVSSNKIISRTSVTTTDIATTLGETTHKVSELCNSDYINQWSFYKPVSLSKAFGMTDDDFYSVDDGFTIGGGVGYYSYPSQLVKAISNNTAWVYNKIGKSYCRMGDFRGYSHLARPWFLPDLNPSSQKIGQGFKYKYVADNPDLELPSGVTMSLMWLLNNFNFLRGFSNSTTAGKDLYSLCLIYTTSMTPTSCMVQKVEKVLTILGDEENLIERGISVKVPVDLSAGTTYYVIPCIANIPTNVIADADPLEDARAISISEMQSTISQCYFYPIPTQPIQFKALAASEPTGTPMQYFSLNYESGSATLDRNVFSNVVLNMTASFSSAWTQSYTATVSVECYVDGVFGLNNQITSVKIGQASTSLTRGQSRTLSVSYNGNLEKASSKEETLPVRCEVIITVNGTTYTRTETLYIDNVAIV